MSAGTILTAVQALSDAANAFEHEEKLFAEMVSCEHRTIQQGIGRLMVALIEKWAADFDNKRYDARNEATVRLCHNIVNLTRSDSRVLPLI